MYCPKCGNENDNKAKFCRECGYDFASRIVEQIHDGASISNEVNTPIVNNKIVKTVSVFVAVIFSIPIIFFVFVIVVSIVVFSTFAFNARKKAVEFKDMSVPTIYKVTGEAKTVCSFGGKKDNERREYGLGYCNDYSIQDINEYMNYLITEEGFSKESQTSAVLYKYDGDYKITVTVNTGHVNYLFEIKEDINEEKEQEGN